MSTPRKLEKPTTIAFLLSSLKFGGAERVALNLAHAFKAKGIDVCFLLMSYEGEFLGEALAHFEVINLQCDRTFKLPWKIAKYLYSHRPYVLISSFWKLNLCSCVARLSRMSTKLLLWEHSPPSKSKNSPTLIYGLTASFFYQVATKIITVSSGVRDDITNNTIGLGKKLCVIYNPILPPRLSIEEISLERHAQIVWVGRLEEPKNPALAIEAFYCYSQLRNSVLNIIGDGSLRQNLERMVKSLDLEAQVVFHGFQDAPYKWLTSSQLLLLSSDREGLGNVLIEGLFSGIDIVSTNCGGGISEILCNGNYGTIVPPRDPVALSQAMLAAMQNPRPSANQLEGAKRFVPDLIAKQFLSVLI